MLTLLAQAAVFRTVSAVTAPPAFGGECSEIVLEKCASICARLAIQKSTGFGLSCLVAYNSGSFGSPFSHTSSIERFGENP